MSGSGRGPRNWHVGASIADALSATGWLSSREEGLRRRLLEIGKPMLFEAGQALFRTDEPAEGVFGVADGAVCISVPAGDTQELMIYHAGSGFWVGDLELISNQPRMATVTAAAPTSCLFLPRKRLLRLLEDAPQYYRDFYLMTCDNGRMIMRALANMTVTGSDRRVALRVLQYHESASARTDWISISQDQLAVTTGLSVTTVRRVLNRMADAGLVEIGYRRLRVLDRAGLRRISVV